MLRVSNGVRDGIRAVVPQPAEWRRIRDQIDAAMFFAWPDYSSEIPFAFQAFRRWS
jgi:hypothetical protein